MVVKLVLWLQLSATYISCFLLVSHRSPSQKLNRGEKRGLSRDVKVKDERQPWWRDVERLDSLWPQFNPSVLLKAPCSLTLTPLGAASCCLGKDHGVNNNKTVGLAHTSCSLCLATSLSSSPCCPQHFVLPAGLPGCYVYPLCVVMLKLSYNHTMLRLGTLKITS